ncbi:MAG TPA: bifunctional 3,4-dihydroxy-2-butanone-4-phosphate synthase/GTP cyclohydrolase II [Armatimonadetes bacterium]|nr:bifunctional 3,4-dihydroxy-2-butanone-4-phosphate synthase/GTP cyclohydrolase II [Armatimonadota bacterium]
MFAKVEEALEDIRAGRMVIVVDDEDRENEGDLVMAAEKVTPEAINFMTKYARGLICVPLTRERLEELGLELMVADNTSPLRTAFTVSVDAKHGTTTGISAFDRARTVQVLIDPHTKPRDLARPGHIFPLMAVPGGVLRRAGHTEAAVDLARMAGLYPAGVICEILREDGHMARLPALAMLAQQHQLKILTIADLIEYRRRTEKIVRRVAHTRLPTDFGEFEVYAYESLVDDQAYIALVKGDIAAAETVLVRTHSSCLTGDVFHSQRCDCGAQLHEALHLIQEEGCGVVLYVYQEGRGIGLLNKLRAYELQDQGMDTVEANKALGFPPDLRDYGIGAQVLTDLGVRKMRLLTNNPKKIVALQGYGLEVVEQVPLVVPPNANNVHYLDTKRRKLGHLLPPVETWGSGTLGLPNEAETPESKQRG